jgi:tRNA pseudouridine38-40 synthase
MKRYFIDVCYDGASFGGFQIQQNQQTIQGELENAMNIIFRQSIALTGASRTDAGVHAMQNFLHFDTDLEITSKHIYNLNSILPNRIVVNNIYVVPNDAHSRFDAIKRGYLYKMHTQKSPFLEGRSWFYPFPVHISAMQEAADVLLTHTDFESFSKKKTTVNTFDCTITKAQWIQEGSIITFNIDANRFLRGMIRGLVGTMLQVGRGQINLDDFREIIRSKNEQNVDFSTPAHGLYLSEITYPDYFQKID